MAAQVFGDRTALASRYHAWLAGAGVERGLLGPREVPRLWERHILNSVAVAELVGQGASVVDIGAGAGLPGIPLALRRPDLQITLVEPLLRRATFLDEVVADLELGNVVVRRARAEELPRAAWSVATARAVAPLGKLAGWLLPLVVPGGLVAALKGASAAEELERDAAVLRRLGATTLAVREVGGVDGIPVATAVTMLRALEPARLPSRGARSNPRPASRSGPNRPRGGRPRG
ncbi:16S rRNA (guanine527-N7)-methyltransferase [Motilibacter peucedani]|uniref:Ribosomal RNA small subunit methyltransferase G n=1 Tax=Motilibacter peucedani TaxID=598650 RepID=A0A420XU56_9ACTN|nr:16S rRNA (guanine527-N7)-methyltransferase [Motilibacter peucedani]